MFGAGVPARDQSGGICREWHRAALGRHREYDGLIGRELLSRMSSGQAAILDVITESLETRSTLGRRNEVHYLFNVRRGLAPYNSVKAFDLEVYASNPTREVLSWLTELPERFRYGKDLLKAAMHRQFPNVASIPYASR